MPDVKQPNRRHHGRKLQHPEIHLVRAQVAKHALRRLRQPKASPEVDADRGRHQGKDEPLDAAQRLASPPEEDGQQDAEDAEGADLKCQSAEQDRVGRFGTFPVGLGLADHGRPRHLHARGDDVARHEEDYYHPRRQDRRQVPAVRVDQYREDGVDRGREEDGRDHDEEVLEHEVEDEVGILACSVWVVAS